MVKFFRDGDSGVADTILPVDLGIATGNRKALMGIFEPGFQALKETHGIEQLHFHVPPGQSFFRVQKPDQYGEMIAYRTTVIETLNTRQPRSGLEWGWTGLGIRGVVPVIRDDELVGSVEIGFPFGKQFCEDLKMDWGPHFSTYEKRGEVFA